SETVDTEDNNETDESDEDDSVESENEDAEDNTETDEADEDDSDVESENDSANSEASDGNGETSEANSDASESSSDSGKKPEKLEDLSWDQINEMMETPEGKAELMRMNADFRERYEADMWGMTLEEYQDYKAACERYKKEKEEKEKEKEKTAEDFAPRDTSKPQSATLKFIPHENSKAQDKAEGLLAKFEEQDAKSSHAYMTGSKGQNLKDLSDQNSHMIKDLKASRQEVKAELDSVWQDIKSMNYDETKDSNPEKYQELCDKYYQLEALGERLDYSIVKLDMDNYDISEVTGTEYRNEGSKKLDDKEIASAYEQAETTLKEGVSDNDSIMNAYRLGEKLKYDVVPSLDASFREANSRVNLATNAQESYLREHGCSHEEAMKHPDGQYARNEQYKQSAEKERDAIAEKMSHVVELSTSLRDHVPLMGEDCTLKVTDNSDGTVTIERSWDNGGTKKSSHEGRIHDSKTTTYFNAMERKDSITVGENSGSVYAHEFSFQYRGLAFKREDTFGGDNVKLKNVAEGGFVNFNFSAGFKRGTEGKMSTVSAEVSGSAAQLKDTASVVVKDKEYKAFSAEVACMKGTASAKMDSYGIVSAKASAYTLGGDASVSVGKMTIGKASGHLGEASASWSTIKDASAKVTDINASVSVGNNLTIASAKYKDGGIAVEHALSKDPDASMGMDIRKDFDAIKDAKKGKLGEDISEKPVAISNEGLKKEVESRPADYEAKDSREQFESRDNVGANIEVGQDVKASLAPFEQSK
ncbi:MAG: hypothetical protein K5656_03620, partial [Lachnospiraceae bacterium]|nr:hypothetical protein [Lachnospiraceae bacterium]